VTSKLKSGRGGRRYPPYAFTEEGVAMLSSVLNSPRAIKVNIEIMRAFVRLRKILASHAKLARKLETLEKKYDAQFKVVFDAIRQLMEPSEKGRKKIGFQLWEKRPSYGSRYIFSVLSPRYSLLFFGLTTYGCFYVECRDLSLLP
jgi:hypothetical protein